MVIYRIMDIDNFITEYQSGESKHNTMQHFLVVAQLNKEKLIINSGFWKITPAEIAARITKYDQAIELVKADYKEKTGRDMPDNWGM